MGKANRWDAKLLSQVTGTLRALCCSMVVRPNGARAREKGTPAGNHQSLYPLDVKVIATFAGLVRLNGGTLQTPTSKAHTTWVNLPDTRLKKNNRHREITCLLSPLKSKADPWGTRVRTGMPWEDVGRGGAPRFPHVLVLNLGAGYIGTFRLLSWALIISALFIMNITLEIKYLFKRGLQLPLGRRSNKARIQRCPPASAPSSVPDLNP